MNDMSENILKNNSEVWGEGFRWKDIVYIYILLMKKIY